MKFTNILKGLNNNFLSIAQATYALVEAKQTEFEKIQTELELFDESIPSGQSNLKAVILLNGWCEIRSLIHSEISSIFEGMGQEWFNRTFLELFFPPELHQENFDYLINELSKVLSVTDQAKKVLSTVKFTESGTAEHSVIFAVQAYFNLEKVVKYIDYALDDDREGFTQPYFVIDLDRCSSELNDFELSGQNYELIIKEKIHLLKHIK